MTTNAMTNGPERKHPFSNKIDLVLNIILVLCAVLIVGVLVRREFQVSATSTKTDVSPQFIENWKAHLSKGIMLGRPDAPVQIIEFGDFECSFCATFHARLKALKGMHGDKLTVTYVHFPLPMHRFARPAARAAECADREGRFAEMADRLYMQQEGFGLKAWGDYAKEAGIRDLAKFDDCLNHDEVDERINVGQRLAVQVDARRTPTVIINGWKLGHTPSAIELDGMVKEILAGRSPIAVMP